MSLSSIKKDYLDSFSSGFKELYWSKLILMVSAGFLGLFLPIFLLDILGDHKLVFLYFGISSLLYAISVPLGGLFLNRFGFRNALRMSVLWGVAFYSVLYFLNQTNLVPMLTASIIFMALFRVFYWTPYIVDFAKFTSEKHRGKQLSLFSITQNITGGLVPILSGFIIASYGFGAVFIVGIVCYLLSGIFYLRLPKIKERFDWSYLRCWKELLGRKNRKAMMAFFADGTEGFVGSVIWPVFVYELLNGDYLEVGYISAFVIIFTVVLQVLTGRYLDKGNGKKVALKYGTFLYSVGWIVKIFVVTAFHIFIAGVYHNIAKIFSRTSFDALTYDLIDAQEHYVDEFTVIHEMAVHLGRFVSALVVVALAFFFPLQWTFLVAATASIVMSFVTDRVEE